jgi:hypothetical protein
MTAQAFVEITVMSTGNALVAGELVRGALAPVVDVVLGGDDQLRVEVACTAGVVGPGTPLAAPVQPVDYRLSLGELRHGRGSRRTRRRVG